MIDGHSLRVADVTLTRALARDYGLDVRSVQSLPGGFTSDCFLVHAGDRRCLVKVWNGEGGAAVDASRRAALRLLASLNDADLGARFPCPVPTTSGPLFSRCELGSFVVLTYVDGQTPPDWPHWPVDVLERVGQVLARIHGATPRLSSPPGTRDPFDCSVLIPMRRTVALLRSREDDVGPELRSALAPRAGELAAQLDRVEELGARAAAHARLIVLCHTDFGGDNLLVAMDGTTSPSRRATAIADIDTWGFDQWRRLDETIDSLRDVAG